MSRLTEYLQEFEKEETERKGELGKPLLVRLDGRAFKTFTTGLAKPYDERMSNLMRNTAAYLVRHTQALIAYTQSDEITIAWYLQDNKRDDQRKRQRTGEEVEKVQYEYFFDGRYQKLCSICSSMASTFFNKHLPSAIPEKAHLLPIFDARAWSVPTPRDAYLAFLAREQDAIKNSITMAALAKFPHKKLQNVNGLEKREMLREAGAPWESMPEFFKRGSFFKRVEIKRFLTDAELEKIPVDHRPVGEVPRQEVREVFFPELSLLDDPEKYLFTKTIYSPESVLELNF